MVTLIRIMCISTLVSLLDRPGSRVLLKLKTGQEEGARHGEVEGAVWSSDEGNILRLSKAAKLGLEKLWLENGNFSCVLWIQSFRADWIHLVFCFAFTSTVNIVRLPPGSCQYLSDHENTTWESPACGFQVATPCHRQNPILLQCVPLFLSFRLCHCFFQVKWKKKITLLHFIFKCW